MNKDLFDMFENLKGLKAEDATKLIPSNYVVRVVERSSPMTAEYMLDRLNLVVDSSGVVEETFIG